MPPGGTRPKRLKIFAFAKGYYGARKRTFGAAIRAVHRAWQRAYVDRRRRARSNRAEWIQSANAGARALGLTFSQLVRFLPAAGVQLSRNTLATLAVFEPFSFRAAVEVARAQLVAERGEGALTRHLQREPAGGAPGAGAAGAAGGAATGSGAAPPGGAAAAAAGAAPAAAAGAPAGKAQRKERMQ